MSRQIAISPVTFGTVVVLTIAVGMSVIWLVRHNEPGFPEFWRDLIKIMVGLAFFGLAALCLGWAKIRLYRAKVAYEDLRAQGSDKTRETELRKAVRKDAPLTRLLLTLTAVFVLLWLYTYWY